MFADIVFGCGRYNLAGYPIQLYGWQLIEKLDIRLEISYFWTFRFGIFPTGSFIFGLKIVIGYNLNINKESLAS